MISPLVRRFSLRGAATCPEVGNRVEIIDSGAGRRQGLFDRRNGAHPGDDSVEILLSQRRPVLLHKRHTAADHLPAMAYRLREAAWVSETSHHDPVSQQFARSVWRASRASSLYEDDSRSNRDFCDRASRRTLSPRACPPRRRESLAG